MKSVLVVSSFEKGRGSGHLVRSCNLVFNLQKHINARLFIPSLGTERGRSLKEAQDIFLQCGTHDINLIFDTDKIVKQKWDLIVTDLFKTENDIFYLFKNSAPVLAIDEGGTFRSSVDFLLDLLPVYSGVQANFLRCDLLPLPELENRKQKKFSVNTSTEKLKVLISFGSEDAADLGRTAAAALCGIFDITLVSGILYDSGQKTDEAFRGNLTIVPQIKNMREHLHEYDLLITHFGISAFEALCAGTLVILVSPTVLHKKTSQYAGFYSAGYGKKACAGIPKLLCKDNFVNDRFISFLSDRCRALVKKYHLEEVKPDQSKALADFIEHLDPQVPSACPVCGNSGKIIARFNERTYKLCNVCSMYYLLRITPPDIEYSEYTEKYFFESYKKQYGKTYLEDFPALLAMAKKRLASIRYVFKRSGITSSKTLLDIGCAYGAFLVASQEEGFVPYGIDISAAAVSYVTDTLHIQADKCDFPNENIFFSKPFDVITLWYVVEHFQNLKAVFQKIKPILQRGGVLAFSTPSACGISARKSIKNFLQQSPEDHRTILDPRKIKPVLKAMGFDVKKIVITGHHPERFPVIGKYLNKFTGLYKIVFFISRIFKLGDTFEVYAVNR